MKKKYCILFISIIMLSVLSILITAQSVTFEDVPQGIWYHDFVYDCVAKGLMEGTSETSFSPEKPGTRALFIQTMYNYYRKNIQGTDKDLNHLGHDADYIGGYVGTETKVDGTNPFTLEQTSTVRVNPDDPATETEIVYKATSEQLLSGSYDEGFYAANVKKNADNSISFESAECLTVVPDSSTEPFSIFMSGGSCVGSGYSGTAKRVTAYSTEARIEAQSEEGSEFEITLCDLGSNTAVIVRGVSSGNLSAELYGYDLTVKGAKGEYTVEVYEWAWEIEGDVLKRYACPAETENSCALPFSDINDSAFYTEALKWAKMRKLTAGVSKTEFAPNAPVTREQMATFLNKFICIYHLECVKTNGDYNFTDKTDISDYAKESVEAAAKTGMMSGGTDGKFYPKSPSKRCEVAAVFSNLDNVLAN